MEQITHEFCPPINMEKWPITPDFDILENLGSKNAYVCGFIKQALNDKLIDEQYYQFWYSVSELSENGGFRVSLNSMKNFAGEHYIMITFMASYGLAISNHPRLSEIDAGDQYGDDLDRWWGDLLETSLIKYQADLTAWHKTLFVDGEYKRLPTPEHLIHPTFGLPIDYISK